MQPSLSSLVGEGVNDALLLLLLLLCRGHDREGPPPSSSAFVLLVAQYDIRKNTTNIRARKRTGKTDLQLDPGAKRVIVLQCEIFSEAVFELGRMVQTFKFALFHSIELVICCSALQINKRFLNESLNKCK